MKKPFLIFIVVAILMNAFIYFYPADIFQYQFGNAVKDVTLESLFNENYFSNLTLKGWFMLAICSVGIPVIIAWRSTLTKYSRKTGEEKKSIFDKLK